MAGLMNQRMVGAERCGGVTFWALIISIGLHLIVLTVFGFVKFSPRRTAETQDKQRLVPTAKITRIRKLIATAPIISKPKIKRQSNIEYAKSLHWGGLRPIKYQMPNFAKPSGSASRFSASSVISSISEIEIFGGVTDQRKICYLVDCSGSMKGVFGQVRSKLKDFIRALQPDQYFYIIFFGNNRLFELGDGQLIRATQKAKYSAYDFIDSAKPAGQTNTLAAMERAVQIRDSAALSPSIVYFLTDGFELSTGDTQRFSQKIANILNIFAPGTKINTIGFGTTSDDRKMLEAIARQSDGESVFITDGGS